MRLQVEHTISLCATLLFSKYPGATSVGQSGLLSIKCLSVSAYSRISNRRHFAPDICTVEPFEIGSIFVCASLLIFALGNRQAAKPRPRLDVVFGIGDELGVVTFELGFGEQSDLTSGELRYFEAFCLYTTLHRIPCQLHRPCRHRYTMLEQSLRNLSL